MGIKNIQEVVKKISKSYPTVYVQNLKCWNDCDWFLDKDLKQISYKKEMKRKCKKVEYNIMLKFGAECWIQQPYQ